MTIFYLSFRPHHLNRITRIGEFYNLFVNSGNAAKGD